MKTKSKPKQKKMKLWIGVSQALNLIERSRNDLDQDLKEGKFHTICCRQFDGRWKFNSRILKKYGLVYHNSPDLKNILSQEGWK